MGKKKSWFTHVKRLFISEPKPKSEKKGKNSRSLFKTLKSKHYSSLEAPETMLDDAERGQHAIAIATAAAAAAEAAIAAANAAAEVARLTNISQELRRKKLHSAAKKIQTCYKGYLARKALSALKGVVKLQAVVRGELARRHVCQKLAFISLWELRLQRSRIIQEKKLIPATLGTTNLAQLKLRNAIKHTSPFTHRRRSFCHVNDKSTRDDDDADDDGDNDDDVDDISSQKPEIFPAYMATTESSKAKAKAKANAGFSRSPNQRRRRLPDSCSCQDSPSKLSISSWSSFNSELINQAYL